MNKKNVDENDTSNKNKFEIYIKPILNRLFEVEYLDHFNKLFNPIKLGFKKTIFWVIVNCITISCLLYGLIHPNQKPSEINITFIVLFIIINSILLILFKSLKNIFVIIFNVICVGITIYSYFKGPKLDDNTTTDDNSSIFLLSCITNIFYVLYLFFIHTMNIKISCGKHTSMSELFRIDAFTQSNNLYKHYLSFDKYKINELIENYKCFSKTKLNNKVDKIMKTTELSGGENNQNNYYTFKNTKKINNINTDFNETLNIYKNKKDINPSKKYLSLNIYLIFISILQACIVFKFNNETLLQTFVSVILVLIFFIWTCVVNLPLWILILIIVVTIVVYLSYGAYKAYQEFKNNPDKQYDDDFLCKPHIIPIVNKSWAPKTFSDNINYCINNKSNSFFLKIMQPYLSAVNKIETEMTSQRDKLSNLSGVVSMFEDKVKALADNIYKKIQAILDKLIQIRNKIYDIFKNIFEIFRAIIVSMINLMFAISSIQKIIDGIPFICFDENTSIKLKHYKQGIKIKDIKLGDILEDDNEVIGVIKSRYMKQPIYSYHGIIVTGDHYVYENEIHKKIENCKEAKLLSNYNKEYVYCLITSNQKIRINNITFSDYFDIDNIDIQYNIQNDILCKLNNMSNSNLIIKGNTLPLWCFEENTDITLNDGTSKKISEIKIGDNTNFGEVYASQNIKVDKDNIFNYKNVITTGDQIVQENDKWIRVKDSKLSKKTDCTNYKFYNISTSTNKLKINNIIFTDFEQYNNYGYEQYIIKNEL